MPDLFGGADLSTLVERARKQERERKANGLAPVLPPTPKAESVLVQPVINSAIIPGKTWPEPQLLRQLRDAPHIMAMLSWVSVHQPELFMEYTLMEEMLRATDPFDSENFTRAEQGLSESLGNIAEAHYLAHNAGMEIKKVFSYVMGEEFWLAPTREAAATIANPDGLPIICARELPALTLVLDADLMARIIRIKKEFPLAHVIQ